MSHSVTSPIGSLLTAAMLLFSCGCSDSKPVAKTSTPGSQESKQASASAPTNDSTDRVDASAPAQDIAPLERASTSAESERQTAKSPAPKSPSPKISADAFRMAAYEGRLDSVRAAVESGIDVNGVDPSKTLTALHMAAYNGHTETVQYLIEQGAKVDCRDAEGKTPLIHACTGPFAESVKVLIEAGADVNARDATEGFTPLMMAAGLGQPEVVEVLLAHKADKSLLDDDKESAADHAKNSGHTAIVEMLK